MATVFSFAIQRVLGPVPLLLFISIMDSSNISTRKLQGPQYNADPSESSLVKDMLKKVHRHVAAPARTRQHVLSVLGRKAAEKKKTRRHDPTRGQATCAAELAAVVPSARQLRFAAVSHHAAARFRHQRKRMIAISRACHLEDLTSSEWSTLVASCLALVSPSEREALRQYVPLWLRGVTASAHMLTFVRKNVTVLLRIPASSLCVWKSETLDAKQVASSSYAALACRLLGLPVGGEYCERRNSKPIGAAEWVIEKNPGPSPSDRVRIHARGSKAGHLTSAACARAVQEAAGAQDAAAEKAAEAEELIDAARTYGFDACQSAKPQPATLADALEEEQVTTSSSPATLRPWPEDLEKLIDRSRAHRSNARTAARRRAMTLAELLEQERFCTGPTTTTVSAEHRPAGTHAPAPTCSAMKAAERPLASGVRATEDASGGDIETEDDEQSVSTGAAACADAAEELPDDSEADSEAEDDSDDPKPLPLRDAAGAREGAAKVTSAAGRGDDRPRPCQVDRSSGSTAPTVSQSAEARSRHRHADASEGEGGDAAAEAAGQFADAVAGRYAGAVVPYHFRLSLKMEDDGAVTPIYGDNAGEVTVLQYGNASFVMGLPGLSFVPLPESLIVKSQRVGFSMGPTSRVALIANLIAHDEFVRNFDMRAAALVPQCIGSMRFRPYLLAGMVAGTGRLLSGCSFDVDVPERYRVTPKPEDVERLIGGRKVFFYPDNLAYALKVRKETRLAPIRIHDLAPHMPDPSDNGTMIAGIAKRLMPERASDPTEDVLEDLTQLTDELATLVRDTQPRDEDELLEEMLRGRPLHEATEIRRGWEAAREDPAQAIEELERAPYKCFVKAEAYPDASFKPPRFIMTLTLEQRGMQAYFLRPLLDRIERATATGNVKHLKPDEVTEKIRRRFDGILRVCETDYTAFESSITPVIKKAVENRLFRAIAEDDDTRAFIKRVLGRRVVNVMGPTFAIPQMPHIRMSGDQHTSIGNLVTNLVVSAYATRRSVSELLLTGLFEGDDGVFPLGGADPEILQQRAAAAGFTLKVDVGRWDELSFCGRNFAVFEDHEHMARSSERVLVGLTTLFSARQDSLKHDLMLQRSKALSVLACPYAPRSTCVAAIIEFATRACVVSERYLTRNGLLKEYSPYGVESCVPDWLKSVRDGDTLAEELFKLERSAGGDWSYDVIRQAVTSAMSDEALLIPLDFVVTQGYTRLCGYAASRGVSRFTDGNRSRYKWVREDGLDVSARRVFIDYDAFVSHMSQLYVRLPSEWLAYIAIGFGLLVKYYGGWTCYAVYYTLLHLMLTTHVWAEDRYYEPKLSAPLLQRIRHWFKHNSRRPYRATPAILWPLLETMKLCHLVNRLILNRGLAETPLAQIDL